MVCRCACGNEIKVRAVSLKNGHTKSCGCLRNEMGKTKRIDITRNRYGRLVAISFSHSKNGNTYWNCLCDCGIETKANYSHLVSGRTRSCGCIKREILQSRSGENNHLWRGGVSHKPWAYPKEWNNELKESIRNRDLRKCQFPNCKHTDIGMSKRLDVHHIDGNKQDCNEKNLVSLCHSHHMKVEMSPSTWEDYFYSVISDYYFR